MIEIVVKAVGGVAVPYYIEITKGDGALVVRGDVYWVDCAHPLMVGCKYKGHLIVNQETQDATFLHRGFTND